LICVYDGHIRLSVRTAGCFQDIASGLGLAPAAGFGFVGRVSLGEGRDRGFYEGDGVRVSRVWAYVSGILAVLLGAVSRCVSIAVASLSLSLSLSWPGRLAARAGRRPGWAARLGGVRRVGFLRGFGLRLSLSCWRGACPSVQRVAQPAAGRRVGRLCFQSKEGMV
jgi:hypothetical protein